MVKKCFMALVMTFAFLLAAPFTVNAEEATRVTILHTNDIHGRFVESSSAMGIDLIAAIYYQWENAILVDAGDTFHGVPFVNFNQGENAAELMNLAGYSLFTPGNHDFNFGYRRLLELEGMADFGFISANIYRGGELLFDAYSLVEVGGLTLGFFGLAYPGTPQVTHPDNVAGLYFSDPVEAAQEAVEALLAHEVDVIIALAHLGIDGANWTTALAQQVEGLDLIIDGHSHTLLPEGQLINGILVAQAGDHMRNLGVVEIELTDGELSLTASIISQEYALENFEAKAEVTAVIEEMSVALDLVLDEVVAYSPVAFSGDRDYIRSQEMPLGNLIADSMRWATDADFALANSGGIRDDLPAGDITKGDIITVLAFFNYAVVIQITPAELRAALENGVSNMPGNGRFPQISGFSFVFDQGLEEGSRIISISVDGVELDLEDNSTVFYLAINDFMAAGGDGYTIFEDLPRVSEAGSQDELLIAYLAVADISELDIEGRIINLYGMEATEVTVTEEEPEVEIEVIVTVVEVEELEEYVVYVVELVEVVEEPVVIVLGANTGVVVNCWYLNVRNAGSPEGEIVDVIRVGTVINILETSGGWHRMDSGWVYGGYIELN